MKNNSRILRTMAMFRMVLLGMALCMCSCAAATESDNVMNESTGSGTTVWYLESKEIPVEDAKSTDLPNVDDYFFIVNGVTIAVDMDMDEVASKLGESKSIFEAPSCAGEGMSYLYNYVSYEIETYPAGDGKNRIGYIILKDDMVGTAEKIDLSMTKADVIAVYGEEYEESANKITYEKSGTKLNFIFDGDNIISIEYVSAVIG